MIIIPFYLYGLHLAIEEDSTAGILAFCVLIFVTLLGVWDAINS